MCMLSRPQIKVPIPHEREGYAHETAVSYAPGDTSRLKLRDYRSVVLEKRLAWAAILASAAWAWQASGQGADMRAIAEIHGPLEICGLGALMRLHAAWRRATMVI